MYQNWDDALLRARMLARIYGVRYRVIKVVDGWWAVPLGSPPL